MKFLKQSILLVACYAPITVQASSGTLTVAKGSSGSIVSQSSTGATFQGMTETGVIKNTFLCGQTGVGNIAGSGGQNFESDTCTINAIQTVVGFDISGGKTVQFFNNFTYWLQQKGQQEEYYKTNNPDLAQDPDGLENKMNSDGWAAMGAYCILITTNEILQETVEPTIVAGKGQIKVIVQLLYNGGDLIQLWSQDVALLEQGQSFVIGISNAADTNLPSAIKASTDSQQYLAAVSKAMQPNNRASDTYNAATGSPRTVRIVVQ